MKLGEGALFPSVVSTSRVRASSNTDTGVTAEPKNWLELGQNVVLISESEKRFLEKYKNGKITSSIPSNFFLLLSTEFIKQHNHKVLSIFNFIVAVERSLHVDENMQNFGCIDCWNLFF